MYPPQISIISLSIESLKPGNKNGLKAQKPNREIFSWLNLVCSLNISAASNWHNKSELQRFAVSCSLSFSTHKEVTFCGYCTHVSEGKTISFHTVLLVWCTWWGAWLVLFLTHLHCSLCAPDGSCSDVRNLTPGSLHEAGGQFLLLFSSVTDLMSKCVCAF